MDSLSWNICLSSHLYEDIPRYQVKWGLQFRFHGGPIRMTFNLEYKEEASVTWLSRASEILGQEIHKGEAITRPTRSHTISHKISSKRGMRQLARSRGIVYSTEVSFSINNVCSSKIIHPRE